MKDQPSLSNSLDFMNHSDNLSSNCNFKFDQLMLPKSHT